MKKFKSDIYNEVILINPTKTFVSKEGCLFISRSEIKIGDTAIASNTTNGKIKDFFGCKTFVSKSNYAISNDVLKVEFDGKKD